MKSSHTHNDGSQWNKANNLVNIIKKQHKIKTQIERILLE